MISLAIIVSIIASLCVIMGVVAATEVVTIALTHLTPIFWLGLGGVLFLAAITALVGRGKYEE